jgi:preprotein translocase subunit SecY
MSPGLRRRIAFTIGVLLVYRLGTYIPLPGIDLTVWKQLFRSQPAGVHAMAIFALGITPYVSAAVLIQLVTIVAPPLQRLRAGGERGNRMICAYALYLALLFAAFQAYVLSRGLEEFPQLVTEPGLLFRIATVVVLTGGTLLAIWLSEQITMWGVGNGLALILFIGVVMDFVEGLPGVFAASVDFARRGVFESNLMIAFAVFLVAFVAMIVFMELARRRVPVEYPAQQVGHHGRTSNLSLKLNSAGIIPIIVGSWLLSLPLMLRSFGGGAGSWFGAVAAEFEHGRPAFLITTAVVIILLALLYTAFVLDPDAAAEKLKAHGGVVPGVTPGEATAAHLDCVVSRTVVLGAAYLALIALIPDLSIAYAHLPFYFDSMSALVVVCVVLDISAQVRGDGLMTARGIRQ